MSGVSRRRALPIRGGRPVIAAVEGSLVDVVLPGAPGDVIVWENRSEAVSLAPEDPNPAYDEVERLWHLRFRAHTSGLVVLRLTRQRPGHRPVKVRVSLRIGPNR